jgi:hypothetical protein
MDAVDDAGQAQSLEDDARRWPDEAGELLLEAAEVWRRAGEYARALGVAARVVAMGGENGEYARVSLAETCFVVGRDGDAKGLGTVAGCVCGRR